MEGRLKFLDKIKEVMLIDGDPFLEVTLINMTSANLANLVDNCGRSRKQKIEGPEL